ncbi:MAG: DNA polymerase I [Sandaracinaceae bacterium]|nr:DNA polymerase I [Myxococcales bacterium]MCB9662346.1 DNA polymerase I [Sandaracinaceae bacterium]
MSETDAPAKLPPKGDAHTLYLIDISSYVFRAYHALPPLSNSRGEPTHAVQGVTSMLLRLIGDRAPAYVVVAHDAPGPSFRRELYEPYKANRPPAPPDLSQQITRVKEVAAAWGLHPLERSGFEADDIIATITHRAREAGLQVVIVSADKDLLQLVTDGVTMYDTMREKVFGRAETIERMGVPPEQVRDLLALMGDSSDNVPGVKGVGQKTAAKLLEEHGSLDGIYAAVETIKAKALKQKLLDNRALAYVSRDVVSLRADVDVLFDLEAARYDGGDAQALRKIFTELEFTRMLAQMDPAPTLEGHYQLITDEEDLRPLGAAIRDANALSIHSIVSDDDARRGELLGVALTATEGVAAYVPVSRLGHAGVDAEALRAFLAPLLSNSLLRKVGDVKREHLVWGARGVIVRGERFDPTIASYLLDPGRHGHSLEEIARAELDAELTSLESVLGKGKGKVPLVDVEARDLLPYAAQRADFQLRLSALLGPRMDQGDFHRLMFDIELPLARVLAGMERVGVRLDVPPLEAMAETVARDLAVLEARCHELAGEPFNVGSPKQLEHVLFDVLDLPVVKKTKTGRSTDQSVLEELAPMHPLPEAIIEHRSLAKLASTYIEALPREVDPRTGRIHTHYNQAVAATGRLSSSDPNLQNIPIRTEIGRRIRECFVAQPGWMLMAADYSQIELRVLAHLSRDPELVEAYRTGMDVHVRTATALFDVPAEQVTREQRAQAKTVNFAVIYGQTQFALARNLKIERSEAKRYIDAFFARYAGVQRYMDDLVESAHRTGFVTTELGRKRTLNDIRSRNHNLRAGAERIARNTPIQGTAADIIKIAMVRIDAALRRAQLRTRMLLSVHDELVFEVPEDERAAAEALVRPCMEGAMALSVPLVVDIGWGPNWVVAH